MIIKEFLPNPVGRDQDGEYIKLLNDSTGAVFLDGWKLKDNSGKIFELRGRLTAGQELLLLYLETKISLNNSGEKLFLYDASGKLVDELDYSGQAEEGQIITKNQQLESKSNFPITNDQLPVTNVIFLDFLTAAILAALGLYIILELERKLEIKLF